jgi:hypothetical protein
MASGARATEPQTMQGRTPSLSSFCGVVTGGSQARSS